MKDYSETVKTLRLANSWQFAPGYAAAMLAAADAIEELQKELDAAVADLRDSIDPCTYCRNKDLPSATAPCLFCSIDDDSAAFEWRGAR